MTPEVAARFKKENAGETADGNSEHKTMTARDEHATGYTTGQGGAVAAPVAGGTMAVTSEPMAAPVNAPTANQAVQPVQPVQPTQAQGGYAMGGVQPVSMTVPATDSQSANAPNGMRFAGSGSYQWYRQGNLTWRVNTATGSSCIVYATMDEWRKQIVMANGCGRGV